MCSTMFLKNGRKGGGGGGQWKFGAIRTTGNMFPIGPNIHNHFVPCSIIGQIDFVLLFAIKAK